MWRPRSFPFAEMGRRANQGQHVQMVQGAEQIRDIWTPASLSVSVSVGRAMDAFARTKRIVVQMEGVPANPCEPYTVVRARRLDHRHANFGIGRLVYRISDAEMA
jgi:hypothetical protein